MKSLQVILGSYIKAPHQVFRNISWHRPKTVSDHRMIFVLGAPRSGTTLMERILHAHSRLFSAQKETGLLSPRNIFSRDHFGLSTEDNKRLFSESCDVIDFLTRAAILLESRNEGRILIEKTPQHVLRLGFLVKHFPNARFIHVVRDGRDGYCSALKHPNVRLNSSALHMLVTGSVALKRVYRFGRIPSFTRFVTKTSQAILPSTWRSSWPFLDLSSSLLNSRQPRSRLMREHHLNGIKDLLSRYQMQQLVGGEKRCRVRKCRNSRRWRGKNSRHSVTNWPEWAVAIFRIKHPSAT